MAFLLKVELYKELKPCTLLYGVLARAEMCFKVLNVALVKPVVTKFQTIERTKFGF